MDLTLPKDPTEAAVDSRARPRVAIIGGGPSGLMTAHRLERHRGIPWAITLFEATSRLGGKLQTCRFERAPVMYEAGVAECYDFPAVGQDALRTLVHDLGLRTSPNRSTTVVLNGCLIRDDDDIRRCFGERTLEVIRAFRRRASAMLPLSRWHRGFTEDDNRHPWADRTTEDILDELPDPIARKYFKVVAHSDMATEPHLAGGLVGLRNVLRSVPGYDAQYSIDGGMEMLSRRLAERLAATRVELDARVARVSGSADGTFTVHARRGGRPMEGRFDAVVLALPYSHLLSIDLAGERLRRAMTAHVAHYDSPAHYLRVAMLFRRPFWRRVIPGPWIMLDAFGGCCVYNESARHDTGTYGVLSWLLAGADALTLSNADDSTIVERAIDSLPGELQGVAAGHFLEAKVHRWAGVLSGRPGGATLRSPRAAHRPEPVDHPSLVVAGDYLFDSTLNGVLRSAGVAADLLAEVVARRAAGPARVRAERKALACAC